MTRANLFLGVSLFVGANSTCLGCGSSGASGTGGGAGTGGTAGSGGSGGGAVNLPGNSISGTVMGMSFTTVATSYWIGKPSAGGAPTQVYLLDEQLPCQAISAPGWDKTIGANSQVLEMDLAGPTVTTFHILMDADASYVGGPYNPSADGGSVTITTVNPSQNIVGSFNLTFGATSLMGTFDASYCAAGVEP